MKPIRIGILGGGRGADVADNFRMLGCDVAALCDFRPDRLEIGAKKIKGDVALFSDFDEFLDYGLDGVVIANYFHEHAPYVKKCFERNVHVYCECLSNGTMAEGVELYEAHKTSKSVFMLAENYPQMLFNREMRRICDGGTLGKIMYAEGEYNHPADPNDGEFSLRFKYFEEHWRHYLPRTYYITHSLGPIMWATGATPKTVSALSIYAPMRADAPTASQNGEGASIITMRNDDGSVFRVTGCSAFGGHHNAYRICGTDGQIENLRGMGDQVMLRYNHWSKPEGMEEVNLYTPAWNDPDEALIQNSGHGGSDYLTARMFINCIKEGRQPEHPFNLKSSLVMSSCAILAHRSAMEEGKPYAVPDFDSEADRELYRNDRSSPFYTTAGAAPTLPCCATHPDYQCTPEQLANYKKSLE